MHIMTRYMFGTLLAKLRVAANETKCVEYSVFLRNVMSEIDFKQKEMDRMLHIAQTTIHEKEQELQKIKSRLQDN